MLTNRRTALLAVSLITLAAMVLLASGLSDVYPAPGRPISVARLTRALEAGGLAFLRLPPNTIEGLLQVVRVAIVALLPLALIHFFTSRSARQRILFQLFYLLLFTFVMLNLLGQIRPVALENLTLQPLIDATVESSPTSGAPAAPVPSWLVLALSSALAAAILAVAYRAIRKVLRPDRNHRWRREIRRALQAVEAGGPIEDEILRCYRELLVQMRERRGLLRPRASTVSEFEGELTEAGLPPAALARLSRLFEEARYGQGGLGPAATQEAVSALEALLRSLEKVEAA